MRDFIKPRVVVSKCLGFAHCRYNGLTIEDDFVKKLDSFVEFQPVCPEVEIGLGVPRNPIRLVSIRGSLHLMQPATQKDVTKEMERFADSFLDSLPPCDGFVLKNRSPSCGIKDVKIYPGLAKVASIGRGAGFFGGAVLKQFFHLAVEDEGRLNNDRIREHFLTKLFTLSGFRKIKASKSLKDLIRFHSENKLLLMAYNQKELRELGRIVASPDKKKIDEVYEGYERHLSAALSKASSYPSNINVLMHAMGYFKKDLSAKEKAFFLDALQRYRVGRIPLSVTISLMRSWVIRFDESYLMQQTYFEPYPEELVETVDRTKERDVWR